MTVELNCYRNMMVNNFQLHFSPVHSQAPNRNGALCKGSLWHLLCGNKIKLLSTRIWYCCLQWPQAFTEILNGKCASNKSNRWALELATYYITVEWISEAHSKAADCLLQLVDVKDNPTTPIVSIHMLVMSTPDCPTTGTNSKTCNSTDTTLPIDASTIDRVNACPPLTDDQKDTLRLMQRMDPFCKCISKRSSMAKHPHMKLTHLPTLMACYWLK